MNFYLKVYFFELPDWAEQLAFVFFSSRLFHPLKAETHNISVIPVYLIWFFLNKIKVENQITKFLHNVADLEKYMSSE